MTLDASVFPLLLALCLFFFDQMTAYEISDCRVGSEMCVIDSSNNLQIVSLISAKLKKNLDARFSEVTLLHGGCSFLSYLFKERFNLIGQEILVSYFKTHIYIAAFTDQDLSLFNIFEISGNQDILKYMLIALDQLN